MLRNIVALVVVAAIAPASWAQNELKNELTPDYVESTVIKKLMNTTTAPGKEDAQNKKIYYATPDGHYDLEHHYGGKLLVFVFVAGGKAPADKVNAWNGAPFVTKVSVGPQGNYVISAALPYAAGITPAQIESFYNRIQTERTLFNKILTEAK